MADPTVNSKYSITFTSATSQFSGLTLYVSYWAPSDWPGAATGTIVDADLTKAAASVTAEIAKNILDEPGAWRFQLFESSGLIAFQPVKLVTVKQLGES